MEDQIKQSSRYCRDYDHDRGGFQHIFNPQFLEEDGEGGDAGEEHRSIVQATTSWFEVRLSGASIPTATSLRRNPIKIATIDSLGSPQSRVTMGAVRLARKVKIPMA